jgi:hypothetical protein
VSSMIFPSVPGLSPRLTRAAVDAVNVQTVENQRELRILTGAIPRYRYTLEFKTLRSSAVHQEFQSVVSFLTRHGGRWESFLLRDPEDCTVTDHGFAVGNGTATAFQLQRTLGGKMTDFLGTWPTYTKPRTNAARYSRDFANAAWTKEAAWTVATAALEAPDGTVTATTFTTTAAARMFQDVVATNGEWSCAFWVRAGSLSTVTLRIKDRATDTIRATTTASLTGVWQRISATGSTAGASAGVRVEMSAAGAGTFHLWNGQAERASAPTADIVTTSAAVRADPAFWPSLSDGFEPVTEPAPGIQIYKDGVLQAPGTGYTRADGGVITFASPPAAGAVLSWTGDYYQRVRYDDEEAEFERFVDQVWLAGAVPLITVI